MAARSASPPVRTLTRADLTMAIYGRLSISKEQSAGLLDMMLTELTDALARGEDVKLASFGAFVVRDKCERIGRNPKTGGEAPIAARRVVLFQASQILRESVCGDGDKFLRGTLHAARGDEAPAMRKSA